MDNAQDGGLWQVDGNKDVRGRPTIAGASPQQETRLQYPLIHCGFPLVQRLSRSAAPQHQRALSYEG